MLTHLLAQKSDTSGQTPRCLKNRSAKSVRPPSSHVADHVTQQPHKNPHTITPFGPRTHKSAPMTDTASPRSGRPHSAVVPDRARLTSPASSLRNILRQRVLIPDNTTPLIGRPPSSSSEYQAISPPSAALHNPTMAHLATVHDSEDVELIVYRKSTEMAQESSLHYLLAPPEGPETPGSAAHDLSYFPATAGDAKSVGWGAVLPYYLPLLSWVGSYLVPFFVGDLIGGVSLATFQIPLCLSYATTLAHVPVISGLYSLGVAPLIYMVFGSVPQMVVGPEGPISLIVGLAVEPLLHHAKSKHLDPLEYVVAITFVSGASLLGFGLGRFGFLDNVLCESLLKGFISGVGIVMVINALVAMLGLSLLLDKVAGDPLQQDIHLPFDKMRFLFNYSKHLHPLTFKISFAAFAVIMTIRTLKKLAVLRLQWRLAVYVPEILIVVAISTYWCAHSDWNEHGIDIIGTIHNETGGVKVFNPLTAHGWPLIKLLSTLGFLCAMLGFFESTTASKSLGSTYDLPISSNRELVALGFINIVGSVFGGLPAFGGYGRSKINAISAKTTMLGAIMGFLTLIVARCATDMLYFVPKCILSVISGIIGILLIEEAPFELYFHWISRGYSELITFFVTVLTTIFFSMEAGIAVGLVYLLIRVIKHLAESRIQILGRYPGTNTFLNADIAQLALASDPVMDVSTGQTSSGAIPLQVLEKMRYNRPLLNLFVDDHVRHLNTYALEEIEGCLIVKIPEPLTFTNTNDLRSRLKRVEMYGSTKAHPALKRVRDISMTKYIIFDLDGMTEIDSLAGQILVKLLEGYRERQIRLFFVRVNKNLKMRKRLQNVGVFSMLMDDLAAVRYFEVQKTLAFNRIRRRSISESISGLDLLANEEIDMMPLEGDDAADIYDLTEAFDSPYFDHISDALKVIDFYEINQSIGDPQQSV